MAELMDFVKDGKVFQGVQSFSVQVESEDDLENLAPYGYTPGTMAFTAGFAKMWQLDSDGNWVSLTD